MPNRRSGRSTVARNQTSSPSKESIARQSQTPPRRRTTRSQSVDLGETNAIATTKRAGKRNVRQGSVDSVESNGSSASARTRGTKKGKVAPVLNRKLSMVAEAEHEPEESDDMEAIEENHEEYAALPAQSPGAMSQMSGITAISSFTAMTSRSDAAIRRLDPAIAEDLPQLYLTSLKIVNHLAPADTSEESVGQLVARLRNPVSKNAARLRKDEELFSVLYDRFLSSPDATYLRTPDLLRLFLGKEVTQGEFRPDAIIHLANIATMIKEFLVTDRQSQAMGKHQFLLDRWFPELFTESFGNVAKYGQSKLADETFEMALEIRTQFAITALVLGKEREDWNPELILKNTFLDSSENPKSIIGMGTTNSKSQANVVEERMEHIRSTFRKGSEAQDRGDLVDFETLGDDLFPWSFFLSSLVSWARLRTDEIMTCIDDQGGADGITQSLLDMNLSDSQVEVENKVVDVTENQTRLLPDIIRGTKGRSLQTPANIKRLKEMVAKSGKRKATSSDEIVSNKKAKTTVESSSLLSNLSQARPSTHGATPQAVIGHQEPPVEDWRPAGSDDESELLPLEQALSAANRKGKSSVAKTVVNWNNLRQEKNKENLPVPSSSRPAPSGRHVTRDPDGERVTWTQRDYEEGGEVGTHQQWDQSQESEDDGFQEDRRIINFERRAATPPAHHRAAVEGAGSPPRQRPQQADPEFIARGARELEATRTEQLRQQAHARARRAEEDEEEEQEGEYPLPTPREIREQAKLVSARGKPAQSQRRIVWSEADEQTLVELIEMHGACWAEVEKNWEGEREVNQVSLRDKARNLKVAYLKSGAELPMNFEHVAMGAKEIRAVKATYPEYEYVPGLE